MLLKRNLYWIAIGVVLTQLSIAEFWNGSNPAKSFGHAGDCVECGRSAKVDFPTSPNSLPLNQNLMTKINAFGYGDQVAGMPQLADAQAVLAKRSADEKARYEAQYAAAAKQAPLIAPTFQLAAPMVQPGAYGQSGAYGMPTPFYRPVQYYPNFYSIFGAAY